VDAEAWLADERRLISAGVWSSPAARQDAMKRAEEARLARVFEDYATRWLDSRHDVRPSTRASYSASLTHHLVPWFGRTPVDEITSDDVRAWYASYGNRTPTARAHAYAVLTAVMARAVDDELIVRTPCRVKSGGRTKVVREPEVLTLSELLSLADAMPRQHRALTLMAGLCGLRFGEAVALRLPTRADTCSQHHVACRDASIICHHCHRVAGLDRASQGTALVDADTQSATPVTQSLHECCRVDILVSWREHCPLNQRPQVGHEVVHIAAGQVLGAANIRIVGAWRDVAVEEEPQHAATVPIHRHTEGSQTVVRGDRLQRQR
jgi:hypothetical protein